jgi:hypothetical protein
MTGSCHLLGVWGFVGRLFFGPGIAKPRPGKSSQGGEVILPANFGDVGLKIVLLCLGDSRRSNVTCFVVAVNKAFATDVPASTHEGGVVPFGMILRALSSKVFLPGLAILHQEFGDGGDILCNLPPFVLACFPLLPSFFCPRSLRTWHQWTLKGFSGSV